MTGLKRWSEIFRWQLRVKARNESLCIRVEQFLQPFFLLWLKQAGALVRFIPSSPSAIRYLALGLCTAHFGVSRATKLRSVRLERLFMICMGKALQLVRGENLFTMPRLSWHPVVSSLFLMWLWRCSVIVVFQRKRLGAFYCLFLRVPSV